MPEKLVKFRRVPDVESALLTKDDIKLRPLTNNVSRVSCKFKLSVQHKQRMWFCDVAFWRDGVFQNGTGVFDFVVAKDPYESDGSVNGNFSAKYFLEHSSKGDGVCEIKPSMAHEFLDCKHKFRSHEEF